MLMVQIIIVNAKSKQRAQIRLSLLVNSFYILDKAEKQSAIACEGGEI